MTTPTAHNNAPANNDPVALVIAMIRDAFTGNFDTLLAHVTDDCIFIGAGANTFRGREDLEQRMGKAPAIPRYTVRDEHFEVVPTDSENDIVVAGSYAIFSDGDTKTISSEIQRTTMNLRWDGERWRAYLVHVSNRWAPLGEDQNFPLRVSEQTYRYVQAILRASKQLGGAQGSIALASGSSTVYVNPGDLLYAEAQGKESVLHLISGTTTVRQLLGSIENSLPREFVRISRKHIVNVLYVSKVEGNTILLADETLLPIPKRKIIEVRRALGALPQRKEQRGRE